MRRLLFVLLAACPKPAPPVEAPEGPPPDEAGFTAMPAHYLDVEKAREALVEGDLDQAKRIVARVITDTRDAHGPDDWQVYIDQMTTEGEALVGAKLFSEAALALGRMGVTCGECHLFAGRGPSYEPRMPPTPGKSVKDRMLVHHWGATKLWEGLVGPAPRVWEQGAQALAEAPLWRTGDVAGEELPDGVRTYEAKVRVYAQDAVGAGPSAELYAGVVATCSGCHFIARQ